MAIRVWEDNIKNSKTLTVFATSKVVNSKTWFPVFQSALTEFNNLKLGVTLSSPANVTQPDPDGEGGAEIQFDIGNGTLQFKAFGQDFTVKDGNGATLNFSPFAIHGRTEKVSRSFGSGPPKCRRAFIFVPEKPMADCQVRVGKDDFKTVQREAGAGVKLFIAVHELIHAAGPGDPDHSPSAGKDADVFSTNPNLIAGAVGAPGDDKFLMSIDPPRPTIPPIFVRKRTSDLVKSAWQ
jgi:hypothetical protein